MGNSSSRTEPLVLILREMGSGVLLQDQILPLKRDFQLSVLNSCNDCVITPGAGCSNGCRSYFEAITSYFPMGMKALPTSHGSSIIPRKKECDHGQK